MAKTEHYDVIVIGGGASGLMCASVAGQRGRRVLVLDRANKLGKKILMSGGGRCNFTNYFVTHENYLCSNPHFCKSALSRYTQWDFIALVERYGIAYHERKHGELFCDHSAKDILQMLVHECQHAKVELRTHCEITQVSQTESGYTLTSKIGTFNCESLVVATGGLSIPTMGASGFGYELAQQFGLEVIPTRAALVPFTFTDQMKQFTSELSGLAHEVRMHNAQCEFRENLLFTHRGISGPVALQVSSYWKEGESIAIDLLPDIDTLAWLKDCKQNKGSSLLRNVLAKHLSKNFCQLLQQEWWPAYAERPLAEFSDQLLSDIADKLHHWQLKPSGTEGYRTAEVTLGGVNTDRISSKTMESRDHKGLYFIGEVLDVTGHLGGFNFQWAWASGVAAGEVV